VDSEHLEAYLSGELDEQARLQVERALRHDADLRSSFVAQAQMEAALRLLLSPERAREQAAFNEGVLARLRSEGAGDRGFAKSVLLEIVEEREGPRPARWPDLLKAGLISAAASVGLLLLLQSVIYRPAQEGATRRETPEARAAFAARVERSDALRWAPETARRVGEDGWLPPGLLRLESGSALVAFNSGATALVEGPAEFSVESNNRLFLKSGSLAAEVPQKASGFTVNTPRLNAVDLGTRFGVSVDAEGNSELHVMEGLVSASRTSGNTVATVVQEGLAVSADGRVRTDLTPVPYEGERFRLRLGAPAPIVPALRFGFDESSGAILEHGGREQVFDIPLVASGELDRSPRRAAGRLGGGLVFQSGESLDIALPHEFTLDEPHTLAFWLKLPAGPEREGREEILVYGSGELPWRVSCHFDGGAGIRGAIRVEGGEASATGSTDVADGNWHHVAYRYLGGDDLASRLHLFIDGRHEAFSDTRDGILSSGRSGNLRLGGRPGEGFHGWIDELHLYRESLPTTLLQGLSE
jgi:hypothetical protein